MFDAQKTAQIFDEEIRHFGMWSPWENAHVFGQFQDEQLLWIAEHAMNVPGPGRFFVSV